MYSIGEFSKICGLSIDTLRYYEKQGLISAIRGKDHRRFYNEKDIAWVQFIIRLKKTGMKIKDIQKYAELRAQGDETIPERIKMLFAQLDQLHDRQYEIEKQINFLEKKIKYYLKID